MSRYLIYSCEGLYEGLHGMNDIQVCECESDREAWEIGVDASLDFYAIIAHDLQGEVDDILGMGEDIDEDEAWESVCRDNVVVNYWKINEEKAKNISITELDSLAYDLGVDLFVEQYCLKQKRTKL